MPGQFRSGYSPCITVTGGVAFPIREIERNRGGKSGRLAAASLAQFFATFSISCQQTKDSLAETPTIGFFLFKTMELSMGFVMISLESMVFSTTGALVIVVV